MEVVSFLDGVPLSSVKNARFVDKLGSMFTLARLVLNGITYRFTASRDGAVFINTSSLSMSFVSPEDLLDEDVLLTMTVSELLEAIAQACETTYVSAWEDYVAWMADEDSLVELNAMLLMLDAAFVGETQVEMPVFTVQENFSGFVRWVNGLLTPIADQSATNYLSDTGDNLVQFGVALYQAKLSSIAQIQFDTTITDYGIDQEYPILVDASSVVWGAMSTVDGLFSRPVPCLNGALVDDLTGYACLVYLWSDINTPGWYGITSTGELVAMEADYAPSMTLTTPIDEDTWFIETSTFYACCKRVLVEEPEWDYALPLTFVFYL